MHSEMMNSQPPSLSPLTESGTHVLIREFKHSDRQDCREMFTQGMEQLIRLIVRVVFPKYVWFLSAWSVLVFVIAAAFQWPSTVFLIYIFTCAILLSLLYVHLYMECWKFIDSCLATDLKDIGKNYMSDKNCHMWVAEWNGKVVGMVGLIHSESHKAGVAELQRMSVLPACRRMGIARKLLDELLNYARYQRFQKIVLTTTSVQTPAIRLYKKYGFKLTTSIPYPQFVLSDLQFFCFELEL